MAELQKVTQKLIAHMNEVDAAEDGDMVVSHSILDFPPQDVEPLIQNIENNEKMIGFHQYLPLDVSPEIMSDFISSFTGKQHLRNFTFSFEHFDQKAATVIADLSKTLPRLSDVSIFFNSVEPGALQTVSDALKGRKLSSFEIGQYVDKHGEDVSLIPVDIDTMNTYFSTLVRCEVERAYLRGIALPKQSAFGFGSAIGNSTTLEDIDLLHCSLPEGTGKLLGASIKRAGNTVERIKFEHVQMSKTCRDDFAESVGQSRSLKMLILQHVGLNDDHFSCILNAACDLNAKMDYIYVGHNDIGDVGASDLASRVSNDQIKTNLAIEIGSNITDIGMLKILTAAKENPSALSNFKGYDNKIQNGDIVSQIRAVIDDADDRTASKVVTKLLDIGTAAVEKELDDYDAFMQKKKGADIIPFNNSVAKEELPPRAREDSPEVNHELADLINGPTEQPAMSKSESTDSVFMACLKSIFKMMSYKSPSKGQSVEPLLHDTQDLEQDHQSHTM